MHKKVELILIIILLIGLIGAGRKLVDLVSSGKVKTGEDTVIIDCGHGGGDPGKVGINNALEKDINLQIGKLIEKRLKKEGIKVLMTREKDEMLAGDGSDTKKVQDMKARVEYINKTAPALAVSIHQNSYHEENVRGAQVFYYSHSKEGELAADIMQAALLSLDMENTREEKANDSYYLLKKTEVPTIIVECGFLSNYEEAELLISKEYQEKVADAVTEGIKTYLASKTIGK